MRSRDGRLLRVEEIWYAEAERDPGPRRVAGRGVDVIWATAGSADAVWARLTTQAELADIRERDEACAPATGAAAS